MSGIGVSSRLAISTVNHSHCPAGDFAGTASVSYKVTYMYFGKQEEDPFPDVHIYDDVGRG